MIKHIFTDMDGTLLNSRGEMSVATVQAIRASAIPVTLVSARAPMEMAPAIAQLGLTAPQVAFNGGLIFQPQHAQPLRQRALDCADSTRLLTVIERKFATVSGSVYDQDNWYTTRVDAGILHEQALTHQIPVIVHQPLANLAQSRRLFKIMLIVSDQAVMVKLQEQLVALNLPVSVKQSGQAYLEITSQQAQKSQGIQYLLAHHHLTAAETAAFGDGYNDLPMLDLVGVPVVMGNASAEIQAAGKFVTKTNDADGVAYGIRHFLR